MTGWWLANDWLIIGWWPADDWLMTGWTLADDWLIFDWWLAEDWLMTGWWLLNDYLMIGWWLADDWLMNTWWLADECLINAWRLSKDIFYQSCLQKCLPEISKHFSHSSVASVRQKIMAPFFTLLSLLKTSFFPKSRKILLANKKFPQCSAEYEFK